MFKRIKDWIQGFFAPAHIVCGKITRNEEASAYYYCHKQRAHFGQCFYF